MSSELDGKRFRVFLEKVYPAPNTEYGRHWNALAPETSPIYPSRFILLSSMYINILSAVDLLGREEIFSCIHVLLCNSRIFMSLVIFVC